MWQATGIADKCHAHRHFTSSYHCFHQPFLFFSRLWHNIMPYTVTRQSSSITEINMKATTYEQWQVSCRGSNENGSCSQRTTIKPFAAVQISNWASYISWREVVKWQFQSPSYFIEEWALWQHNLKYQVWTISISSTITWLMINTEKYSWNLEQKGSMVESYENNGIIQFYLANLQSLLLQHAKTESGQLTEGLISGGIFWGMSWLFGATPSASA